MNFKYIMGVGMLDVAKAKTGEDASRNRARAPPPSALGQCFEKTGSMFLLNSKTSEDLGMETKNPMPSRWSASPP